MGLGQTIRHYREEAGLSQSRLAAVAGISQGYLSQIENEEVQNPSAGALLRLARAMHVDDHCLLQALGYPEAGHRNGGDGFEMAIDPGLLAFVACLSPEGQRYLFCLLQRMEGVAPTALAADNGHGSEGLPRH